MGRFSDMDFGVALHKLKKGHKLARKGWNGKGIHIKICVPCDNSEMTSPYIYIDTTGLLTTNGLAPKSCVPWFASQTDMLAKDWHLVI